jgi:hypothetical protein
MLIDGHRYMRPDAVRKFKVPGGPIIGGYVIPLSGAVISLALIGTKISLILSIIFDK